MNPIKNRLKTITLANSAIASIGQVLETHTVDEYIAGGLLDGLRVLTWAISQEVEIVEGMTKEQGAISGIDAQLARCR